MVSYRHFERKREIFFPRTHAFPTCAAPLSAFIICLSYRQCPIRPYGALSPLGEGYDTRIPSSKKAAKPPPYNKAPSTSVGMTFKEDG